MIDALWYPLAMIVVPLGLWLAGLAIPAVLRALGVDVEVTP